MEFGELTGRVIGAAIKVHRDLGPGLLESAYRPCLAYEFNQSGISFEMEKPIPIVYEGVKLDCGYRADFVFGRELILEVKCVKCLARIHEAQILSYMKLTGCQTGLLINFHSVMLRDGIRRLTLSSRSPFSL